jgi:hypothetical protein
MARQYLAEGLKGAFPFIADVKNIVTESLPDGRTRTRIPGRFSVCDCVNGNGRRYGKRVWEMNLKEGSALMESVKRNGAFGLLEHPKDGQVDLRSNISHMVTAAKLQESKDAKTGQAVWEVTGEIQIIDAPGFPDGQRLRSLIEYCGYNPLVSSRGFGSLVRAHDGIDDVQDDYVCEGWDVVIKPSFESAELKPNREISTAEAATPAASSSAAKITEAQPQVTATATLNGEPVPVTVTVPAQTPTLAAAPGSQSQASAVAPPVKQQESSSNTMNLNEIRTQITSFRSLKPNELGPQRFAEGMSQLGTLHQEVANFVAEDAKRSWQGTQLHDEIKGIETSWAESQMAPGKKAVKLTEDNTKLMQVIKAVASTGLVFKKKLGEALRQTGRQTALLNEVVERGQAWRTLAKQNEDEATKYRRRFMMASEALTALGAKYKADVTEMGKRVIQLEFKDKANTPEIAKALKEATKPKDLVAVRNLLEGKDKTSPAPGDKPAEGAAPITEDKKPAATPAEGAPKAPVSEGVTIMSQKPTDPRTLNEAISMVTRLSNSGK